MVLNVLRPRSEKSQLLSANVSLRAQVISLSLEALRFEGAGPVLGEATISRQDSMPSLQNSVALERIWGGLLGYFKG